MLYICKLSNKFDLIQAIRVSHTGAQQFLWNPAPYTNIKVKNSQPRYLYLIKEMEGYYSKWRKHSATEMKGQWMTKGNDNCATSARGTTTGKRNAKWEFKRINPARTAEDVNIGQEEILGRRMQPRKHYLQFWPWLTMWTHYEGTEQ